MLKKICNILLGILFILLFILASIMFVPNLLGYKSFAVISGSMEPNIPVGSIVYTKESSFDELKKGDIISFKLGDNTMVTHRIEDINIKNRSFTTKGDANDVVDGSPVSYEQVIGKLAFSLPLLGYISVYVKTPLGITVGCGIIAILIILLYLPDIFEDNKVKEK